MKLYTYFRSSASYRVRIALNLKNIAYESVPIHLVRDGGHQFDPEFRKLSPDALVPTLVDDNEVMVQSLAIIEYLDETHPQPPLLPATPRDRAYVRSIAQQIACDIHPVDNLRVLRHLKRSFGINDEQKDAWYQHWIDSGFTALETRLANDHRTGAFCYGDKPTVADLCIVPQVFNAGRAGVDMTKFPTIRRINDHALSLEAFAAAAPGRQPDAE